MKKTLKIMGIGLLVFVLAGLGGFTGYSFANSIQDPVASNNDKDDDTSKTNITNVNSTDISKVVDSARDSVVEIKTEVVVKGKYMGDYVSEGAGSGVIISKDGYIITNDHVIDGAKTIKVTTTDGEEYEAELITTNAKGDIALLKIQGSNLKAAKLGDSDNLVVGEQVVAIGNPLGELGGTVTEGIISSTSRKIAVGEVQMDLLQTSAAINPGNSGGGLFNIQGELIGIVNAKSSGSGIEGLGFAIPINQAMKSTRGILK